MTPPLMTIVGGPNGVGKSTFIEAYLQERDVPYLGADKIAAEIRPEHPESVAFEAGREFLIQIDDVLNRKESFIVESTLSGRSLSRTVLKAKQSGFAIEMHFMFVDAAETSISRVRTRVARGGHDVPDHDVRRRFQRALKNISMLYRPLADSWFLHYNGDIGHVKVAEFVDQEQFIQRPSLFEAFFQYGEIQADDR